jgi:hypothetical protein
MVESAKKNLKKSFGPLQQELAVLGCFEKKGVKLAPRSWRPTSWRPTYWRPVHVGAQHVRARYIGAPLEWAS